MKPSARLNHAAVVLKSLPKAQAAKVLTRFEADEIRSLLDAVQHLDDISPNQLSDALERLKSAAAATSPRLPTIPPKRGSNKPLNSEQLRDTLGANREDGFEFLIDLLPSIRYQLLMDEHPKNLAIILSFLPPACASEVIESLEPATRVSVLRRLCQTDEICPDEAAELGHVLELRLKKLLNSNQPSPTGMNLAAELLSRAADENQETTLAYMSQSEPELAERLEERIFNFRHLQFMSDRDIGTLLKHVDTSCWAPALKHASLSQRTKILDNMAEKAAEILNREISEIGPVDVLVANRAKQQIVNVALELGRSAKVTLPDPHARVAETSIPAPVVFNCHNGDCPW